MSITLYTPPRPRALQFFSLEPLDLAPVAGKKREQGASGATLQKKLEALVALDPVRCVELNANGQGVGFRKAVDLVSVSKWQA